MAIPGLSTLGIQVGYAVATSTTSLPTAFTLLPRCNSADGIELSTESIDASALEDYVTQRVAGRSDIPEDWAMTFNSTPEARAAVTAMITAYTTSQSTNADTVVCIEIYDPKDTQGAYFVFVQPPAMLGLSEISQNSLKTFELSCTLVKIHGYGAGVAPTASAG